MRRLEWQLAVVFALNLAAILIFTSGFFLTRIELPNKSTCEQVQVMMPHQTHKHVDEDCWMKPRFKKAILIVIDALRFDFADYHQQAKDGSPLHPFENKLLVIRDLVRDQPNNAMLLPFVADPPTTTMQRLKGVTTGGLPTFIEFKDDLAGEAITEDNLLEQLTSNSRNITFMGDDTWMSLFPESFTRAFPYPSFNVKDLHTVDNGVLEHLIPEIERDDWGVLVAHFLGVDHVGHRYGPDHPEMSSKLQQMNDAIETLVNKLHKDEMDDTVLFVFGDHGMTEDGNHGGATQEEVTAALFVYSTKPGFLGHARASETQRQQEFQGSNSEEDALERIGRAALKDLLILHPQLEESESKSNTPNIHSISTLDEIHQFLLRARPNVHQVDLAPTLALLLGIPIPFGNLGGIIPELFWFGDANDKTNDERTELGRFLTLNKALDINIAQVASYLETYAHHVGDHSAGVPKDSELGKQLGQVREAFTALWDLQHGWESAQDQQPAQLTRLLQAHRHAYSVGTKMLQSAGEHGRSMWTQFNLPVMALGTAVMTSALVTVLWTVASRLAHLWASPSAWVPVALSLVMQVLALFSNSYIVAESNVHQFAFATSALMTLPLLVRRGGGYMSAEVAGNIALVVLAVALSRFIVARGDLQWVQGQEATLGSVSLETDGAGNGYLSSSWYALATSTAPALATPLLLFGWATWQAPPSVTIAAIGGIGLLQAGLASYYWHRQRQVPNSELLGTLRHLLPRLTYLGTIACSSWSQAVRLWGGSKPVHSWHHVIELIIPWVASYCLVVGPASPIVCLGGALLLICLAQLGKAYGVRGLVVVVYLWSCAPSIMFFGTGHDNVFNKLHYAAPFVGFEHYEWYRCGFMLALNTFGAHWCFTFALPFVVDMIPSRELKPEQREKLLELTMLGYQLTYLARALATTVFVAFQRRHLMVWAIFAPKYVFDCSILLNVGFASILSLFFYRQCAMQRQATIVE